MSKLTAEAKAALERLRSNEEYSDWRYQKDKIIAANIALREHPTDDDDPITFTRLQQLGFGSETMNGVSLIIDGHGGDPVELTIGYADTETETEFIADLTQSNTNDHVLITGRTFVVMGDVRHLCQLLGTTLTPQEEV